MYYFRSSLIILVINRYILVNLGDLFLVITKNWSRDAIGQLGASARNEHEKKN